MLGRIKRSLTNERSIVRGAAILGSTAALGQLAMILSTPIISRIYTPAELGLFALFLSFVNVAVTIAPLGYLRAIPTTETRQEGATLAVGVLAIQPGMCVLLGLGHWFLMRQSYFKFDQLPLYTVFLTGFSVLANTILLGLQFWFIRAQAYTTIGRVQVFQRLGRVTMQIVLGVLGAGLGGLIVGDFSGRILGLWGLLNQARQQWKEELKGVCRSDYFQVFLKYRKFLFPQLPSIFLNIVARMLPVPLMIQYYGAEAAGLYAVVDRLMQVPVAFVSKSFGDALHGRIAEYSRTNPSLITGIFLKSAGGLFLLGIVPVLIVVIWGQPLFSMLLGERWAASGQVAALLSPWALATLVVATCSRVVYVYQAFSTVFWYNLLALAVVVGVFILGSRNGWELMQTVTWLARLNVLAYLLYFLLLLGIVRREATRANIAGGQT